MARLTGVAQGIRSQGRDLLSRGTHRRGWGIKGGKTARDTGVGMNKRRGGALTAYGAA